MTQYYTKKAQVHLTPGEKLGFTTGKGYYAIPAPPPKSAPPAQQKPPAVPPPASTPTGPTKTPAPSTPTPATSADAPPKPPAARQPATLAATQSAAATPTPPPSPPERQATKHHIQPSPVTRAHPVVAYRPPSYHPVVAAHPTEHLANLTHAHGTVSNITIHAAAPQKDWRTALKLALGNPTGAVLATGAKAGGSHSLTADHGSGANSTRGSATAGSPANAAKNPAASDTVQPAGGIPGHVHTRQPLMHNSSGVEQHRRSPVKPKQLTDKQVVALIATAKVDGHKVVNPALVVQASKLTGLPITWALALLTKESLGGQDIWGQDPTIFVRGYDQETHTQWGKPDLISHTVTRAGYAAYKAEQEKIGVKDPHTWQGVGPTQLTTPDLQAQADFLGGAWKPLPNMVIGFQELLRRASLAGGSLYSGAVAYNAGSPHPQSETARKTADEYARTVISLERRWAAILGIPSVNSLHS